MKKNQKFQPKSRSEKKSLNSLARLSGLAVQLVISLLIAAFGGRALDRYFELNIPIFTLILLFLALFGVLYLTIRSVIRK